jgi:hypothetical protein
MSAGLLDPEPWLAEVRRDRGGPPEGREGAGP